MSALGSMSSGEYSEIRILTYENSITIGKGVAIFGFILACATLNVGARYFAMCVFAAGVYSVNSLNLGWVSATCGQTREKKSISLAIVNTISSLAPIYTPVSRPHYLEEIEVLLISMPSISGHLQMHRALLWQWAPVQFSVLPQ